MIRLSDVRYGFRLWRRHPTMVVVAGLSLGLGVGATTTMYSVVNRVANYELGFADAEIAKWFAAGGLEAENPIRLEGNPLTVVIWSGHRSGAIEHLPSRRLSAGDVA